MIFLLGGPPRTGKSTIAGIIRQKHAVSTVSTDSLGAVLGDVWDSQTAPKLFSKARFNQLRSAEREKLVTDGLAEHLNYVRKESQAVWKAAVAFAGREFEEGRDVLIEGVGVLPELVNQLEDMPYRVVFVGHQGASHRDNIKRSAEQNKHDWMGDASDHYVSLFSVYVNRMSVYIEDEARKHGFEYIEMDSQSLDSVAQQVMKSLGLT